MFARTIVAGATLLAFTACSAHRATAPAGVSTLRGGGGPVVVKEKRLTDGDGNMLTVHLDESEATRAKPLVVVDKNGSPIPVRDFALKDATVCLPKADAGKPLCQPVDSMTEGTFFKIGTSSCTCYIVFQTLKCYGTTCP